MREASSGWQSAFHNADYILRLSGLAGATLGLFVQAFSTLLAGYIVGLVYAPKVAAVGIACSPFVLVSGYAELRMVVLREQFNKASQYVSLLQLRCQLTLLSEESAQLAAEYASSIRTVSSLVREDYCLDVYRNSLAGPQKRALKSAMIGNAILGFVQGVAFFIIALVRRFRIRESQTN